MGCGGTKEKETKANEPTAAETKPADKPAEKKPADANKSKSGRADDVDDPLPPPRPRDPRFKGAGPPAEMLEDKITECFKGGLLFRIVNEQTNTWAF